MLQRLTLLSVLEQYPNYKWSDIIASVDVQKDIEPSHVRSVLSNQTFQSACNDDDGFSSFKL